MTDIVTRLLGGVCCSDFDRCQLPVGQRKPPCVMSDLRREAAEEIQNLRDLAEARKVAAVFYAREAREKTLDELIHLAACRDTVAAELAKELIEYRETYGALAEKGFLTK